MPVGGLAKINFACRCELECACVCAWCAGLVSHQGCISSSQPCQIHRLGIPCCPFQKNVTDWISLHTPAPKWISSAVDVYGWESVCASDIIWVRLQNETHMWMIKNTLSSLRPNKTHEGWPNPGKSSRSENFVLRENFVLKCEGTAILTPDIKLSQLQILSETIVCGDKTHHSFNAV